MKYESFERFDQEYTSLYERGMLDAALELLENAENLLSEEVYKEKEFVLLFNKVYIYMKADMMDKCLDTLESMNNCGYICPMEASVLEPVKKLQRYLILKEKNDILVEKAQSAAKLLYEVHLPQNYNEAKKYPIVLSLHGDGSVGSIADHSKYWKPNEFIKRGCIFAYVQSSQVWCHNGYGWLKDPDKARRDISECLKQLKQEYSIDESCVIISGFSGGAITSVDITMSNVIPVKGFIALCPDIRPQTFTREAVEEAVKRRVRGVFMEGELIMPIADEEEMANIFREVGLPFQYYANKGIGHWYPEDLDKKLADAIEFILGE